MVDDLNRVASRLVEMKSKRRIEDSLSIPTSLVAQYAQSSAEKKYFTDISEAATCLEETYALIKTQMEEWTQLVHNYVDWQAEIELGRVTLTKLPSEETEVRTRCLVTNIDEAKAALHVSLERTRSLYDTLHHLRAKADDFIATNNNFITTLTSHNVSRLPQQYRVLVHMYTEMRRRLDILLEMAASAQSHKVESEAASMEECVQWAELIIEYAENEGATPPIAPALNLELQSKQASSPVMTPGTYNESSPRETSPQTESGSLFSSVKRKHAEISFAPEEGRAHLTQRKRTRHCSSSLEASPSKAGSLSQEGPLSKGASLSKDDFDVFKDDASSKEKRGSSGDVVQEIKENDSGNIFKDNSNSAEERSISSAPELSLHLKETAKGGKENTSQEDVDGSSGGSTQLSGDLSTKVAVTNVITRTAVSLLRANTK